MFTFEVVLFHYVVIMSFVSSTVMTVTLVYCWIVVIEDLLCASLMLHIS